MKCNLTYLVVASIVGGGGMVEDGENSPNHILIYRYPESQLDLASNARASPPGVAMLHLDNGTN